MHAHIPENHCSVNAANLTIREQMPEHITRVFSGISVWKGLYTVGTESIQTALNFSLFVILQPFAKII